MLDEQEIQAALHAKRVVPLNDSNMHGPFGLEEMAGAVAQIMRGDDEPTGRVRRSISLPIETWAKLDGLANELSRTQSHHITASDLATALVIQAVNGGE